MISQNFVIVAVILNSIGSLSYLNGTIRGRVKPNRVTWLLWALAPMIAFSAEVNQGVGLPSLMTFSVGLGPALIFSASFINRNSVWKLGRLDIACGILSALGLIFWYATRSGNMAILFSIFADGLAAVPTMIKCQNFPPVFDWWAEDSAKVLSGKF